MIDAAARRRTLIGLARKRAHPGSGSHHTLLTARTAERPIVDLTQIIRLTPYVVVGAVATRLYMPERATRDVDILVRATDGPSIRGELARAGAEKRAERSIGGASWRLQDGTELDVIESPAPWVDAAISGPQAGPEGLPYIDLPYLVLMKLQVSRAQDIADVSRMLGGADERTLESVRVVVQTYIPDAVEDVESLITLGKLEYGDGTR
jgi:hypothetical protein